MGLNQNKPPTRNMFFLSHKETVSAPGSTASMPILQNFRLRRRHVNGRVAWGGGEVRWSAFGPGGSSYKWKTTLSSGYFTPVSQLFSASYSDIRWVSQNSLANQKQPTFSSRFWNSPVDFKLQKFGIFFKKWYPATWWPSQCNRKGASQGAMDGAITPPGFEKSTS